MIRRWFGRRRDFPCQYLVEVVTDYLEGAMSRSERKRLEAHLAECAGCEHYLAQIRRTIDLAGRLTVADVERMEPEARTMLLNVFRAARS